MNIAWKQTNDKGWNSFKWGLWTDRLLHPSGGGGGSSEKCGVSKL